MDNVIAAMEANHPKPTTQKSFYVEISRARDRTELVTGDAAALKEKLEAVTGERISALEGIGEAVQPEQEKDAKAVPGMEPPDRETLVPSLTEPEMETVPVPKKAPDSRGARSRRVFQFESRFLNAARPRPASHVSCCDGLEGFLQAWTGPRIPRFRMTNAECAQPHSRTHRSGEFDCRSASNLRIAHA